jgi:hypothetical protein
MLKIFNQNQSKSKNRLKNLYKTNIKMLYRLKFNLKFKNRSRITQKTFLSLSFVIFQKINILAKDRLVRFTWRNLDRQGNFTQLKHFRNLCLLIMKIF